MIHDSHVHCCHSHDSFTNPKIMVEKAIKMGLSYIAFTDHFDADYKYSEPSLQAVEQIDISRHVCEINALKEQYKGRIEIAMGVECGYYSPANRDYIIELGCREYDVIINSVHGVGGIDCYYPEYFSSRGRIKAYTDYLDAVLESVNCPYDYDIIGHLGYVARKAPYENKAISSSDPLYAEVLDEILTRVINLNKSLEINSSTKGDEYDFLPFESILKRYKELGGVFVSFGSDAHSDLSIAKGYKEVSAKVKAVGFDYFTKFIRGNPYFEKINLR